MNTKEFAAFNEKRAAVGIEPYERNGEYRLKVTLTDPEVIATEKVKPVKVAFNTVMPKHVPSFDLENVAADMEDSALTEALGLLTKDGFKDFLKAHPKADRPSIEGQKDVQYFRTIREGNRIPVQMNGVLIGDAEVDCGDGDSTVDNDGENEDN